jgi:hypothetical protein
MKTAAYILFIIAGLFALIYIAYCFIETAALFTEVSEILGRLQ